MSSNVTNRTRHTLLQRAANLALQVANPSVRLSVCRLSVRHTPVLCQNEGTQRDAVFAVG